MLPGVKTAVSAFSRLKMSVLFVEYEQIPTDTKVLFRAIMNVS